MSTPSDGQVQLFELIFTMSWEDPDCDRRALAIRPGDRVAAVTSGGCNIFSLLLDDPGEILCVDINETQSHLMELKVEALRTLEHADMLAFLGVRPCDTRRALFERLEPALTRPAADYWRAHMDAIERGILGQGKYESFIRLFRKILALIHSGKTVEGLFHAETLEAQQRYFDDVWNTRRWRALFALFFNKRVLARRGLSADYFQFDDGSLSFADSFFRRARHAMTALPVRENFFLSQYLLGRYLADGALPAYLREEHRETLRGRLDRIRIVTADMKQWLASLPDGHIDAFALSNICELMDLRDTETTFREVARAARPGARMIFRNLMIPRTVPPSLSGVILRDADLSEQLRLADRSFVYSRVDALRLAAGAPGGIASSPAAPGA